MRQYGNLHFLRVYEAGHMVPMNQPENALEMIKRFIANDWSLETNLLEDDTCPYEFGPKCAMQEACGMDCHAGCLFSFVRGGFLGDETTECRCGDCSSKMDFLQ